MNVSVVIPTLNEASEIAGCVESARRSGASEIIVVDGGSHDQTVTTANRVADKVLETRAGRAVQQNAGAAVASGEVILFLHADNRLDPECIPQITRASTARGTQICGGFHQSIVAEGWQYRWLETGNAMRVRRLGWVYGDQGIFVSREWFAEIGGFPDWQLMEDVELMRRLIRSAKQGNGSCPLLLKGPLEVSARRWQRKGIVRQTFRNWMLLTAWRCGASPEFLARFYPVCPT